VEVDDKESLFFLFLFVFFFYFKVFCTFRFFIIFFHFFPFTLLFFLHLCYHSIFRIISIELSETDFAVICLTGITILLPLQISYRLYVKNISYQIYSGYIYVGIVLSASDRQRPISQKKRALGKQSRDKAEAS